MSYVTAVELPALYPTAASMEAGEVAKFLGRANAYAVGIIGGVLPATAYSEQLPQTTVKDAVSLAFEIMSKGLTGAADSLTGNITEVGPTGLYARTSDPLKTVEAMLKPYAAAYDRVNTATSERGVRFL
ncbi:MULTISPECIES: hypothetical protein [Pelosinus]|uniref:Uncharacterized protein n=1 Tax=Pelosinus fermentans B4 TaxID=1149862 RepID=I9B468_9FIRM|nr:MULTISPECIES: hypothetical protein [Pelosinus]EIW19917.1 hypothetical protein FB4_0168 [Pelosinus fermentans B4]EIW21226.1 hypothetical protein FA11_0953 [Pelosinus fermentans A11]